MVEGVAVVVQAASVNLYLGLWRFYFTNFAKRFIEYSRRFNYSIWNDGCEGRRRISIANFTNFLLLAFQIVDKVAVVLQ